MPETRSQKVAACIALNARKGKIPKSKLRGASLNMYNKMTLEELKDFCHGQPKQEGK